MGENFGLFKSFGDRLFEGELPTNLGLIGSSSFIDPDAAAFFARVTAAGGTLTALEQIAVNTLVIDMKGNNIWNAMKAIYPMVGASVFACAQNLKSASHTGTFTSGWSFASTGATSNGTSAYMDTNLNPFSVFGTNYAHQSMYNRINNTSGTIIQGVTDSNRFDMGYDAGNTIPFAALSTSGSSLGIDNNTTGFIISYRTSITNIKMLRNNVLKISTTQAFTANPNLNYWLAARNPGLYLNSIQYAFASIGDGLTDTQAADFYTSVQTFQTTLGRQITPFDVDAQAFFDRVTAAGGSLTATEQTAVNTLVIDMKATGTWTGMKAIYPMVGSSAAACAQNLKSSSFTSTFTSGWTFASTGVTPNGNSAYMNTVFIPSTHLSVDSTHASLYLNTNNLPSASDPVDFGSLNTLSQAFSCIQSSLAGLSFESRNLGNLISATQPTRLGFGISSKTSASVTTLYKNGVNVASGNSGGTLPTISSFLGNVNLNGSPYFFGWTNNRIAFHSLGDSLDSTQAANLYTSVQTFQTTLSRQV